MIEWFVMDKKDTIDIIDKDNLCFEKKSMISIVFWSSESKVGKIENIWILFYSFNLSLK